MSKKWQVAPVYPKQFSDQFPELSRLTLQLLYNRKILDQEQVQLFLSTEYKDLYSPYLFGDMEKAVKRIWQAIWNKETICVYGDYDADAVTANAVLQQTFRYLNYPIQSYIPDRFTEGYGLNTEAFQTLKNQGVTLVITVDCGTNSVDVAQFCQANGIDLIITDHHEITSETPQAFALINPKNPADFYPDKQITGVGVAYKLAQALLASQENVTKARGVAVDEFVEGWDKWLLDLVAIGTVADCHSLLGENRILVTYGLKVLLKTKWIGLRQLMENSGLDLAHSIVDTKTIGFTIAPRINAAGRLEHANIALDLLISSDFSEAIVGANRLEEINRRRQDLTARIVSEAKAEAELIQDRPVLLLANRDWPKGLVGIVAGKLSGHYKKPVFVLEKGDKEATGSARTSGEFDVVECLKSASHLLSKFGGHKQAAGLTVPTEKLEELYLALLDYAGKQVKVESNKQLDIEAELLASELSLDLFEEVEKFQPFGVDNSRPLFVIRNAIVLASRLVGNNQQHWQVQFSIDDQILSAIGFNMGSIAAQWPINSQADVVGELIADSWNGSKKLKLKLVDIQPGGDFQQD